MNDAYHASGKIVASRSVVLNRVQTGMVEKLYDRSVVPDTTVERVTYLSEDLRVNGYIARPRAEGQYPVLLWNRGGFGDRGALTDLTAYLILASTAAWGYVVIGTQYRGNMGSEGEDDFGGRDLYDALNLLAAVEELSYCDMSRIGIEGASRGGMTTYRALLLDQRFRCAIVHAGLSDVASLCEAKRDWCRFIDTKYAHLSDPEKQAELYRISALYFASQLPKTVPILLLHGSADRTIPIEQSVNLSAEFAVVGVPYELVVVDGGGHVALKDGSYKRIDVERKRWLGQYLTGRQ